MNLSSLATQLRKFADDRDWNQFHSPKNIVMALSVETSELLEHFQWMTEEQSNSLNPETKKAVSKEIADVQIYLIRLADILGVDVESAVMEKIDENDKKYPVDKVRGSPRKYSDYPLSDEED